MARADRATDTRTRGDAVEAAALALLEARGLRLVARNVTCRGGELDLVMAEGAALVFVEVRYRAGSGFGGGAASVDAGKRRKLVQAAGQFLADHPHFANAPCRFDVVAASGPANTPRLEWLRDAFRADDLT
jgi:putative endonuclease